MTPEQFLHRCPTLWHVGPAGSWDSIQRFGLRTAAQLIEAADLTDEERLRLQTLPRPEATLLHIQGASVVLRDQGPLLKRDLEAVLADGLTTADWIALLNRRVYLFSGKSNMHKLLDKYVKLDRAQEVVTFSPLQLLKVAGDRIELAEANTGAIAHRPDRYKKADTFRKIRRFRNKVPTEVTIVDGLGPDALSAVSRVERHHMNGERELLYPIGRERVTVG